MDETGHLTTVQLLTSLARINGLPLTEAEAEELRPAYEQMRGWLARLRQVLEAGQPEEPATRFVADAGPDDAA